MHNDQGMTGGEVEAAVAQRYSSAARVVEPSLCCAVSYDPTLLEVIPERVIERDYGCGDPSRHVQDADVVLDLGSGSGKTCFIASQVVGPKGRVIGVDANDEMLGLARGAQGDVATAIGYNNVTFLKGRIQDLALDLERLERHLCSRSVSSLADWMSLEEEITQWREQEPMVATGSIDIVVSNCVLNLVSQSARGRLFAELGRVLAPGGRAVISDIVANADVPAHLQSDMTLWSGCVSGAFREDRFLEAFSAAGFHEVVCLERQEDPWTVVEGIEFRSVTVQARAPGGLVEEATSSRGGHAVELDVMSGGGCCSPGGDPC